MKNEKWISIGISILLIGIVLFNLFSVLLPQSKKYTSHDYWSRFPDLKKIYYASQYATKHPAGWIPDETAFAYAGGALISGVNPILVVPDAPPLGKYLIGLSAVLFGNEHLVVLFFGITSLLLLFFVGKQIFSSTILALLPVTLFSFEPIFKNQFIYTPLFDFLQLTFLLLAFYCFNAGVLKKQIFWFILSSISIGCFISIKFFMSGITIILAMYLVLFFHKSVKNIFFITLSFILAPIVLLSSYIKSFIADPNIHRFLGIQKWVFLYHKGQIILPFSVWPLLLLNKWYVWFGNKPVISDPQWTISWPIITVISFCTALLYLFKKIPQSFSLEILMVWEICYLLFLSLGQIFSRYFVILIPVMYIIAIYGVYTVGREYFRKYKKIK
jgi:hypothetical protein